MWQRLERTKSQKNLLISKTPSLKIQILLMYIHAFVYKNFLRLYKNKKDRLKRAISKRLDGLLVKVNQREAQLKAREIPKQKCGK